jgi:hypothetical protein
MVLEMKKEIKVMVMVKVKLKTWENTWVKRRKKIDRNLEMTDAPTKGEVKAAVNKLKNNKTPGPDGISSEILKEGYKCMENKLIVQIWNEERIPPSWAEALICPTHKKGDVQNCENSRGISLVNIAYKVGGV